MPTSAPARAIAFEVPPVGPIGRPMNRALLVGAVVVLAGCSGGGASASPSASGANQPRTIHLILRPGNDTQVSVGSLTGCSNTTSCQGDYRIGNDSLFDAATGKEVGTLAYVEFVVESGTSLFHSPGNTIALAGRGQIVFTETLYDDQSGRPATAAITGGTGEFLGATGYVISRSLSGIGDFVITITN